MASAAPAERPVIAASKIALSSGRDARYSQELVPCSLGKAGSSVLMLSGR